MSAALFNLDNDGTLEILISRANIKKITRVTVAEPGRKTEKIFLPESLRRVANWKPSADVCVHVDDGDEIWTEPAVECSKCGHRISEGDYESDIWNYCPVCGAEMANVENG